MYVCLIEGIRVWRSGEIAPQFFNLAIRLRLVGGWVGPRWGIDDLQTIVCFAPYGNRTTICR